MIRLTEMNWSIATDRAQINATTSQDSFFPDSASIALSIGMDACCDDKCCRVITQLLSKRYTLNSLPCTLTFFKIQVSLRAAGNSLPSFPKGPRYLYSRM